jgi:hypothetical protein
MYIQTEIDIINARSNVMNMFALRFDRVALEEIYLFDRPYVVMFVNFAL